MRSYRGYLFKEVVTIKDCNFLKKYYFSIGNGTLIIKLLIMVIFLINIGSSIKIYRAINYKDQLKDKEEKLIALKESKSLIKDSSEKRNLHELLSDLTKKSKNINLLIEVIESTPENINLYDLYFQGDQLKIKGISSSISDILLYYKKSQEILGKKLAISEISKDKNMYMFLLSLEGDKEYE